jgi:integration host factor subunit beta
VGRSVPPKPHIILRPCSTARLPNELVPISAPAICPLDVSQQTRLPIPLASSRLLRTFTDIRYWGLVTATTKKNLIDRIAESTGTKQSLVETVVQQFFDEIIAELAQGNRLEFRDFGVFETKATPARTARNPRTSEKIQVPAKRRVVFKAGRLARARINPTGQSKHRCSSLEETDVDR